MLEDIKNILPHRYPMLLIDRVLEFEQGKRCKALKNVTGNEDFFQGHFPGNPIMPGVLIVEAMAQTCGIAGFSDALNSQDKWLLFVGIDKARFRRPVVPGDQLIIETVYVSHKMNIWMFKGKAYVGDKLAASADIRVTTIDKNRDSQ